MYQEAAGKVPAAHHVGRRRQLEMPPESPVPKTLVPHRELAIMATLTSMGC